MNITKKQINHWKKEASKLNFNISCDIINDYKNASHKILLNRFRGLGYFNKKKSISLIINPEETCKSAEWIFYHELGHFIYLQMKKGGKYTPNKLIEDFCNKFATVICNKDYGDAWFNKRGKIINKRKKNGKF